MRSYEECPIQKTRCWIFLSPLDLPVSRVNDLVQSGAGGLLLMVPPQNRSLTAEERERVWALEDHILSHEFEIPIYFAQETPELRALAAVLQAESQDGASPSTKSGAQSKFKPKKTSWSVLDLSFCLF